MSTVAAAVARESVQNQHLLPVSRSENFSEWFRAVLDHAGLAQSSAVRGCMVIKPLGYGIWEQVQRQMDDLFKAENCCKNAYFPLFIPLSFMAAEATHVEGFAKECAVVTHYRMKVDNGQLIPDPDARLAEPLIVRPTSETIIGDYMRQEILSYRDLPLELNQWCNVVRWEHETKPFLRTTEFLWQEGHCAYATEEDARANMLKMAKVYETFMTQACALPVIMGKKSEGERFAGAVETMCLEAMVQDGKSVQAGTSHYLGQNFAKASNIRFSDDQGERQLAHTTSWGVSTRIIGTMIMTHSDDDGFRVPPRIAPMHVVIIPAGNTALSERDAYISRVTALFQEVKYEGRNISIEIDRGGKNAGEKSYEWVKKGIPLRFEIGSKEVDGETVTVYRRDGGIKEKTVVAISDLVEHTVGTLSAIQANYLRQATEFRDQHMRTDITTVDEIKAFFADPNNVGFVRAKWCADPETEYLLKEEFKVNIRCLPIDQSGTEGVCVLTGRPATMDAIFGRSY